MVSLGQYVRFGDIRFGFIGRFLYLGFFGNIHQGRRPAQFQIVLFELFQLFVRRKREFDHVFIFKDSRGYKKTQDKAMKETGGYEGNEDVLGCGATKAIDSSQGTGPGRIIFRIDFHA